MDMQEDNLNIVQLAWDIGSAGNSSWAHNLSPSLWVGWGAWQQLSLLMFWVCPHCVSQHRVVLGCLCSGFDGWMLLSFSLSLLPTHQVSRPLPMTTFA